MSSSIAGARRSSTASETTLVDTPSRQIDTYKKEQAKEDDWKSSLDASSATSQGGSSSRPGVIGKAIKMVKSKLGDRSSASAAEATPKPRMLTTDYYPDTAYMWRALAETKM
ncbi:hypothetical protein GGR53DRAFT_498604 [Hypoxylon sp. FL1150]|nr:hypothetical protein GGR53DRAFT_498604 [Hypoxylon sp. FL1150]